MVADAEGNTPLHCAASTRDVEIGPMLLDAGADVNGVNKLGGTPLHSAAAVSF